MATENFSENIVAVLKALTKYRVSFLIIGGTAIAFHGYIRPTTTGDGVLIDVDDFDIWYQPTHPNYRYLLKACNELGLDVSREMEDDFPNPRKSFFRFKLTDFTLDLLPNVGEQLNFLDCYQRRYRTILHGKEVPVLSLEDLITCKRLAGRKKDQTDLLVLHQMLKNRKA